MKTVFLSSVLVLTAAAQQNPRAIDGASEKMWGDAARKTGGAVEPG